MSVYYKNVQERDGISIAIINIYCKYENKAEKKNEKFTIIIIYVQQNTWQENRELL